MSDLIAVRLTEEQLRQLSGFLNRGVNVVAEIRLLSAPGEQSGAWLFVKQIDAKTAEKVRKALGTQPPKQPKPQQPVVKPTHPCLVP